MPIIITVLIIIFVSIVYIYTFIKLRKRRKNSESKIGFISRSNRITTNNSLNNGYINIANIGNTEKPADYIDKNQFISEIQDELHNNDKSKQIREVRKLQF